MTVVVDFFGWSKHQGSLLTFAFYITNTFGRLTGIVLSRFIDPFSALLISSIVALVALTILAIGYAWHSVIVWVTSCILGFVISTGFGNIVSLAYQYGIRGKGPSVMVTWGYVGMSAIPAIVGLLIRRFHENSLIFTCLVAAVTQFIMLVVIKCTKLMCKKSSYIV